MEYKTFVIIGAMDGIKHDDIYNKLRVLDGIRVIFVEPIPYHFMSLTTNTNDLKGEIYYECSAISNKRESVEMAYVHPADLCYYDDYIDGCSCVIEDGKPLNFFMKDVSPIHVTKHRVRSITFDDLMDKYGWDSVDYIQVDCEGYDERIVGSIDLEKYGVKEIKFEKHYLSAIFYDYMKFRYKKYKTHIGESDITFKI